MFGVRENVCIVSPCEGGRLVMGKKDRSHWGMVRPRNDTYVAFADLLQKVLRV